LDVDLVILNEHAASYLEEVQQEIQNLVRASDSHGLADQPGGIFVRKAPTLAAEDRVLLLTAARVVLAGNRGSLASQVEGRHRAGGLPPRLAAVETAAGGRKPQESAGGFRPRVAPELLFDNGLGGFTADGREYLVRPDGPDGRPAPPPAPWINVVANEGFGF